MVYIEKKLLYTSIQKKRNIENFLHVFDEKKEKVENLLLDGNLHTFLKSLNFIQKNGIL